MIAAILTLCGATVLTACVSVRYAILLLSVIICYVYEF